MEGWNIENCPDCKGRQHHPTPNERYLLYNQNWIKDNPEKKKAKDLVYARPDLVTVLYECPCKVEQKHNHHFDYERPYDVIRLCMKHHMVEHKRLRSIIPEGPASKTEADSGDMTGASQSDRRPEGDQEESGHIRA